MHKKKKILIITNGSNKVGMGHIYRSISIAKALKEKNIDVCFSISKNKNIENKLRKIGKCYLTNFDQKSQLKQISQINPDIIIIDLLKKFLPYKENFWKKITILCKKIITIDYDGKELQYVDIAFNPLFKSKFVAKKNFSGINYCPIRNEFVNKRKKYKVNKNVESILIIQGGADTKCFIPKILSSLKAIPDKIKISIIVGSEFKCKKELKTSIKKIGRTVIVLEDVKKIAKEMNKHDLIITSAGVTLIEILTIGIPSIIISAEKHELENAERISRKKAALSLGYGKELSQKKIQQSVEKIIFNYKVRKKLYNNSRKIVDGNGLERIIKIVTKE